MYKRSHSSFGIRSTIMGYVEHPPCREGIDNMEFDTYCFKMIKMKQTPENCHAFCNLLDKFSKLQNIYLFLLCYLFYSYPVEFYG